MRLSFFLPAAAVIGNAVAGGDPPVSSAANSQWQEWVTVTETKTDYKVSTSIYTSTVTVEKPVTVPVTVPVTFPVTVPTTIISTVTSYVSQPPNVVTVTNTVTNTVTVTVPVISAVPTTIAVTALVTTTAVRTITSTQSALSGLVTCPSRIVNPTYTTSTPLPSNYLWGCPPGKLCYPPRDNCNFEQNLPADTYYCKPEDCRPVADLPPLETYLQANAYEGNGTCAFITPIDDYFNLSPLDFGLNYGIFDIYGQRTCSSSVVCPAPSTITIKLPPVTVPLTIPTTLIETKYSEVPKPITIIDTETVKVPTPVTIYPEKSSSTWATWQGSSQPPHVTKRAELKDLVKRQGQPLIAFGQCFPQCDYAAAAWQSIGDDPAVLCDSGREYVQAYDVALDCITSCDDSGTCTGGQASVTKLDRPRSICAGVLSRRRALFGRKANKYDV